MQPWSMNNGQNMHVCWRLVRVLACVWCRIPQKSDRFMIHALCSALNTKTITMVWQRLQSGREKKRQHNQEPENTSSQYSKLPSNMLGSRRYKNRKAVASFRGRATWVFTSKYVSRFRRRYLPKERPLYTVQRILVKPPMVIQVIYDARCSICLRAIQLVSFREETLRWANTLS